MGGDIIYFLASACAVILVLSLHEFAHAFVAYRCGDPTAKLSGRMTLNPLRHFDPVGLLMFVFVGFGWAKPVPINPYNFKNYKSGLFLTASAGVLCNLLLAFFFYPLSSLADIYLTEPNYLFIFLCSFAYYFFLYNLNFCVFNLLPLYPLDGFRIWDALDRKRGKVFRFIARYGSYILMGLIIESFICRRLEPYVPLFGYLDILGNTLGWLVYYIGLPIKLFWGLFI